MGRVGPDAENLSGTAVTVKLLWGDACFRALGLDYVIRRALTLRRGEALLFELLQKGAPDISYVSPGESFSAHDEMVKGAICVKTAFTRHHIPPGKILAAFDIVGLVTEVTNAPPTWCMVE